LLFSNKINPKITTNERQERIRIEDRSQHEEIIKESNEEPEKIKASEYQEEVKGVPSRSTKRAGWTKLELNTLYQMYKERGTKWKEIQKYFPGRTHSEIKNKFYCELKKAATQAKLEDPITFNDDFISSKFNLLQFADVAFTYGHLLSSKKGRKTLINKKAARRGERIFAKSKEPEVQVEERRGLNAIIPLIHYAGPLAYVMPMQIFPVSCSNLNTEPYNISQTLLLEG